MKKKVILFQGDSITDCGRGRETAVPNLELGNGYVAQITARLLADQPAANFEILNRGISGNRVVDLYARWKTDGLNLKPDLISILIGVNDTWHEFMYRNGVEVPRYAEFYRRLLDWTLTERPKTKIILIEPFVLETGVVTKEWIKDIDARRKVVLALSEEFKAPLVPMQSIYTKATKKAPAAYWLSDGVHPTAAGHQLMTDAWLKTASSLL